MATASYTEITSGLTAGETVVTGQYSDGATSTSSSRPGALAAGYCRAAAFPGGGGFPSGGFPGGGAPPAGGGQ